MSRCQARSSKCGNWSGVTLSEGVMLTQLPLVPRADLIFMPVFPVQPFLWTHSVRSAGSGLSERMVMATLVAGPL